jgi:hypothetical protein
MLVIIGTSGLIFWWKMAARTQTVPASGQETTLSSVVSPGDEPISLTVYLPTNGALESRSLPVRREPDAQSQAREIISVLLAGELHGKGPVLENVKLRELYLDRAGIAFVDLSVVPKEGIRSSAWEELLAVYSLANSILQNVEEVKRVRFLIDGKTALTLSGHLDLTRTYTRRMDLLKD